MIYLTGRWSICNHTRAVRAASHARPPPLRTPERRRSTSPQTSFRERFSNAETR
ncbi:MAG: hypothetical protein NXI28_11325 [bacterium]|nr:hypothetical protein [bacterium]